MKAIGYQHANQLTSTSPLTDIELPMPSATGKDLLVKISAVSVNPVDTKVRQRADAEAGQWKVLGWDAAGIVEAVGDEVTEFKPGDTVFYAGDLTRSGSNAEYQLVDERLVGRAPKSLSMAQAAAIPLTAITAWEMLFDRLKVDPKSNKSLLIIGAAGGVGSIMVQLAKQLTQLTVIGTASRPESSQWLQSLGCDHIINHRQSMSEQLATLELSDVDYVVSLTNSDDHLEEIAKIVAPQGQFGLIDDPQRFDIMPFKMKSVSLHWEFMYTRSMFQTEDMAMQHQLLNRVAELIDAGKLNTTLGETLSPINASNLILAHQKIESQRTIGKIVVEGFDR
ncbi:zinc-binding alcohol dehydrogenase family protein [Ferrimonas aestuarii]|uniref:Zinc-type alcohol dehydrogenase-like protein n=1 Tax=Ferrimonas aestuarii TaxID=2569539 RepID=A0A4U1BLM3_9GAMM|nr:zinc-binding alcohol dehydrogenase family protein [Ferrimonas aestuarii]TKB53993.1 zinc-binding alcohol dehydrogenase family protein [Ferrimonas aestuarii]